MPAIPASQIVSVIPGVVSAGGTGLALSGLMLTDSNRVPIGSVLSFPTAAAVAAYFGGASAEAAKATVYFGGYADSPIKPAAMLFTQYPTAPQGVPGYLRGGSLASMTVAQLQAIASGTITVTIDGIAYTSGTINLSAVASFSAAATAIQTALAANAATVTAAIATTTTLSVTASITGTTLNVTAVGAGSVQVGAILAGTGVTTGTRILKQLTGTANGVGTYQVSASQSVGSGTITGSYGTMTVSAVASGTLAVGQTVAGGTTLAGTTITALLTGTGGTGTYVVTPSQTVSSGTLTAGPALVTYDSTASAFVITGGTPGATGAVSYAASALSTALKLTQATGAVTSAGAAQGVPGTAMSAVIAQTQNFASFTTSFEPSTDDKVLFSAWTSGQNNRFLYAMWDTDLTVTTSSNTASAGYAIVAAGYSGTAMIYEPTDQSLAVFLMGAVASIDFARLNARVTLAFRAQAGITPSVTDATIAAQLKANGYNFYGAYATANDQFDFLYPGSVTGDFLWIDSYVNQIWLNNAFQLALLSLLVNSGSIPYNAAGYAMIDAAVADPINAAVNFGAIRTGVPLSAAQTSAVNNAAGFDIASTLETRGWYFLVQAASAEVRAARGSPACTFWYTDGQSVQSINLSSLEIQ